jgi:hypothetical protein
MQRHRYLEPAEHVRELRRRLSLSQGEFAERLGVTRRTVIRGEQRGLELPLGSWGPRGDVWTRWCELQRLPAVDGDRAELGRSAKCHSPEKKEPVTLNARSRARRSAPRPKKKRLRLSRDRLREWRRR